MNHFEAKELYEAFKGGATCYVEAIDDFVLGEYRDEKLFINKGAQGLVKGVSPPDFLHSQFHGMDPSYDIHIQWLPDWNVHHEVAIKYDDNYIKIKHIIPANQLEIPFQ